MNLILRLLIYPALFLVAPSIGFFHFVDSYASNVFWSGLATTLFLYVQFEMFGRALAFEHLTRYMNVSRRYQHLYLITKKDKK